MYGGGGGGVVGRYGEGELKKREVVRKFLFNACGSFVQCISATFVVLLCAKGNIAPHHHPYQNRPFLLKYKCLLRYARCV